MSYCFGMKNTEEQSYSKQHSFFYKEREKFYIVKDVYYQKNRPLNDVYGLYLYVGYVYVGMVAG